MLARGHAPAVRRACFLVITILLSVLPFACEDDFTGGGGLPGDTPRATGEAGSVADAERGRAETSAADASTADVAADADDGG